MSHERFAIAVPEAELANLRDRLRRTRWPGEVQNAGWAYGTDLAYLRELVAYWADGFDWRAQEARLNRHEHYRTRVGGTGVHFIHARGRGPRPLPLLITHGWPSTFVEMDKIIEPLADPASYGGRPGDAFDVVVPSVPGYGFSDVTTVPGVSPARIADMWIELMASLGYERFGAHGGDWGAYVTALLGYRHAARMSGIHMTMLMMVPPRPPSDRPASSAARTIWTAEETGYQAIQGTKPQTLAYGLTDSPAGLAAWIVEKWRTWSDCKGDVESRFTRDELLTNISIYWFTRTINSSTRLYYEARRDPVRMGQGERIGVPTGFALFPHEGVPPRERAEGAYDLRSWTVMPSGGHFAAMEEPDLLVEDIRAFFRPLRASP